MESVLHGFERISVIIGGMFLGYLGYKLFIRGVTEGHGKLKAENKIYKIVFSGSGPGLFFMAFGSLVLIAALLTGQVTKRTTTDIGGVEEIIYKQIDMLTDKIANKEEGTKNKINSMYDSYNERVIPLFQGILAMLSEERYYKKRIAYNDGFIEIHNKTIKIIKQHIEQHNGVESNEIKLTSSFADDLGMDHLDVSELIFKLEDDLAFPFGDFDEEKIDTVGKVIAYVYSKVSNKPFEEIMNTLIIGNK